MQKVFNDIRIKQWMTCVPRIQTTIRAEIFNKLLSPMRGIFITVLQISRIDDEQNHRRK